MADRRRQQTSSLTAQVDKEKSTQAQLENSAISAEKRDSSIPLLPISDKYVLKESRQIPRWLLLVLGVALFAFTFNALAMINTEPDIENISSGEFWLETDQGQKIPARLSQKTEMDVSIKGLLAHVKLKQTFNNPSDDWVEGQYLFPLPEKAVIHRFEMLVGERRITGQIKEKQQAKKIYTEAKAAGKKVSMLTQQRPNLFTTNIANIAPQESIVVTLEYIEQVQYREGEFQLRLPTTLTPRFLVGSQQEVSLSQQQLEGSNEELKEVEQPKSLSFAADGWRGSHKTISPPFVATSEGSRFSLNASLDMAMPLAKVESLYHSISLDKQQQSYRFSLADSSAPMDRDFVLIWKPATGALPKAGLFREIVDGDGSDYGLLMIIPPSSEVQQGQSSQSIPKEVVYVIDTSGSMGGPSIRQAKQALLSGLERLKPNDNFNIIEFNSVTKQLFPTPVPVNARTIELAKRYVRQLEADGGTVMLPALRLALHDHQRLNELQGYKDASPSASTTKVSQIVFMTDGAISNEQELMTLLHNQLGRKQLFTVGIGSAPNSYFMRKMAEFGRGTFTYIGDVNEVQTQIGQLFKQLESPQMTNIQVHWPEGTVVEQYPQRIPDLYQGEPLILVYRADGNTGDLSEGKVLIEGMLAEQQWSQVLLVGKLDPEQQTAGVAKRWVREKIETLLDQKSDGVPTDVIRQQVLPLALKQQVMSPFTRFIAVDDVVSRPQQQAMKKQHVANGLPHGSQLKAMPYPKTSTGNKLLIYIGFISLSVFFILLIIRNHKQISARLSNKMHGGFCYEG